MQLMNKGYIVLLLGLLLYKGSAFAGEWIVHASALKEKFASITQAEKQIEDLVDQKNKSKEPGEIKLLLEQIVTAHKDLKDQVDTYNELRNHIRFEHPAQGDDTEREYRVKTLKGIDEFEGATGVRGKLQRLKRDMITVYGVKEEDKDKPKVEKEKPHEINTDTPRIKLSY